MSSLAARVNSLRGRPCPSQMSHLSPQEAAFPYEFNFVKIPANEADPMEDVTDRATGTGDILSKLLQPEFAIADPSALDLAPLRAQFGGEAIEGKLDEIRQLALVGTVGVVPLVRPSFTTTPLKHTGTFLYHDDMGLLKSLPPNNRARALIQACGVKLDHPIPGTVFVGRVSVQPEVRAASIAVAEVDPSVGESFAGQEWLSLAPDENARSAKTIGELQDVAQSTAKQGKATGPRIWRWRQTSEDAEVTVTLPPAAPTCEVAVTIAADSLCVGSKEQPTALVELKLPPNVKCRPSDSTWTLDADDSRGTQVLIVLANAQPGVTWPVLVADGALYEADSVCDIDVD